MREAAEPFVAGSVRRGSVSLGPPPPAHGRCPSPRSPGSFCLSRAAGKGSAAFDVSCVDSVRHAGVSWAAMGVSTLDKKKTLGLNSLRVRLFS